MKLAFLLPLALLAACSGEQSPTASASPVAAQPAPAGRNWTETVSRTAEGYVMGNPNAPIKLVEYGSRLCPACGGLAREGYEPLVARYVTPGKVSFEFREFLIHGAADLPPALLGACGGTATFFPLLEQMYGSQQGFIDKWQAIPAVVQQRIQAARPQDAIVMFGEQMGMIDFVKQRGIPEAKARACLTDMGRIDALTKQTQDKGADGTVSGTPTLLINGAKVDGITWPALEQALKAAGA